MGMLFSTSIRLLVSSSSSSGAPPSVMPTTTTVTLSLPPRSLARATSLAGSSARGMSATTEASSSSGT